MTVNNRDTFGRETYVIAEAEFTLYFLAEAEVGPNGHFE